MKFEAVITRIEVKLDLILNLLQIYAQVESTQGDDD